MWVAAKTGIWDEARSIPSRFVRKTILSVTLFYRMWRIDNRPLPHFLIIGAQKAGTSSLHIYLSQHPQILPGLRKEIHFFDLHYDKSLDWYRAHFPLAPDGCITGEASPFYLCHPHVPRRISQTIPSVKLVILLRNPVDRAISHYFHAVRHKRENLPLEEAFRKEEQRIGPELAKMQKDEFYNSDVYQRHSYKNRGIYVDQLKAYSEYFDKEQMIILDSEDFFHNSKESLKEVFSFLNVDMEFLPDDLSPKNIGGYDNEIVPKSAHQYLTEYFSPYNEELYEFLGRDLKW